MAGQAVIRDDREMPETLALMVLRQPHQGLEGSIIQVAEGQMASLELAQLRSAEGEVAEEAEAELAHLDINKTVVPVAMHLTIPLLARAARAVLLPHRVDNLGVAARTL